jgi:m7GpppX diphosphatase
MYEKVTGVYAKSVPKEKYNWIYNILDHNYEAEKTFYADKDPETGFTLCLDLATGSEIKENFHVLALVERRDLLSLRDLNETHLPLLRKMKNDGVKQVSEYFNVPAD